MNKRYLFYIEPFSFSFQGHVLIHLTKHDVRKELSLPRKQVNKNSKTN